MKKPLAILLNIVLPGIGSLMIGKVIQGIIQLVLMVISAALWFSWLFAPIAFFLWLIAFIWGLVLAFGYTDKTDLANRAPPASGIGR